MPSGRGAVSYNQSSVNGANRSYRLFLMTARDQTNRGGAEIAFAENFWEIKPRALSAASPPARRCT